MWITWFAPQNYIYSNTSNYAGTDQMIEVGCLPSHSGMQGTVPETLNAIKLRAKVKEFNIE